MNEWMNEQNQPIDTDIFYSQGSPSEQNQPIEMDLLPFRLPLS